MRTGLFRYQADAWPPVRAAPSRALAPESMRRPIAIDPRCAEQRPSSSNFFPSERPLPKMLFALGYPSETESSRYDRFVRRLPSAEPSSSPPVLSRAIEDGSCFAEESGMGGGRRPLIDRSRASAAGPSLVARGVRAFLIVVRFSGPFWIAASLGKRGESTNALG
ncbi:hypothetical protein ACHAWF_009481 [Thalassiosira exigua]